MPATSRSSAAVTRPSGRITISTMIVSVAIAARFGLCWERASSLRYNGANTIASTTPQKTAP
jgi:hypothetical protein